MSQLYQDLLYRFAFPFNIYNFLLVQEEGQVNWLHYGLFSRQNLSLDEAQQYATDKILQNLPAAPAQVMDVGCGLGGLGSLLVKKGYSYIGIAPDKNQIAYGKAFYPELDERLVPAQFEHIRYKDRVDILIFQESAQYIQPQDLVQQSSALLKPGGTLIAMDEAPAHIVKAMQQGQALPGFNVEMMEDLTTQVLPSLQYLRTALSKHWQAILAELKVTEEQLQKLQQALVAREQDYREKRYQYLFLKARKQAE